MENEATTGSTISYEDMKQAFALCETMLKESLKTKVFHPNLPFPNDEGKNMSLADAEKLGLLPPNILLNRFIPKNTYYEIDNTFLNSFQTFDFNLTKG